MGTLPPGMSCPNSLGEALMYVHANILAFHPNTHYNTDTVAERANEFDDAVLSEASSLPRIRDTPQKLFRFLNRNRWAFTTG